ncbi:MAG: AraC family transcriptional regulator [Lachnospiraceae bacterium]|nr:AraC family transcriptional regulator [Lachnospiraceae bacterium]MCM1240290.1 AraC family transcriptional regulator [Lachnospiraceae bacterium]
MEKYESFCRTFYVSHFLPIAYYENGRELYVAGFPEDIPTYGSVLRILLATPQSPAVYMMPDMGLYGLVQSNDRNGCFVLGPTYSSAISPEIVRTYMSKNAIRRDRQNDITQFLCSIPHFSYNRFIYLLLHLHLVLNGEELSITEHFGISDTDMEKEIASRHIRASYATRDAGKQHGTYFIEKQLLEYVRQGNPELTRQFLLDVAGKQQLTEGTLADTPLRQAKNIFIGTVTMIGKDGAIPGGMDIEQAYQLIDTYIQECERLQSLDAIKSLQYNMVIDFTSRVQQAKLPDGVSDEIFACIQYISAHLIDQITVQDVAASIGKSRAYLTAKFKQETGRTIGEYITDCRMREAKTLLKYTGMSLAEISSYLHFSSQPYFQNVFRKYYGITPTKYRQNHKKVDDAYRLQKTP